MKHILTENYELKVLWECPQIQCKRSRSCENKEKTQIQMKGENLIEDLEVKTREPERDNGQRNF